MIKSLVTGEANRSLADISKIKKDLNWQPKIKIEEGVKSLLNKIQFNYLIIEKILTY